MVSCVSCVKLDGATILAELLVVPDSEMVVGLFWADLDGEGLRVGIDGVRARDGYVW